MKEEAEGGSKVGLCMVISIRDCLVGVSLLAGNLIEGAGKDSNTEARMILIKPKESREVLERKDLVSGIDASRRGAAGATSIWAERRAQGMVHLIEWLFNVRAAL